MKWQDISRSIAPKLGGNSALADERPIMVVQSKSQQLLVIDCEEGEIARYKISTADNGIGNRQDSFKTPFGIHRIRQKIGGGERLGSVFKAREPTGQLMRTRNNTETDEITSRILWLDGLEDGVNKGGDVDTYSRYIYIHGTSDEKRLGQPVSKGCIRMKNEDVIELFDNVLLNDLVIID
ncbi:MAG: lipoprotein-anchoring transpeptidase ErfK/SrfK [Gammaproteobacteria bacterium]|jgi:lipoprotein-anchoring transpeptidase ErfK/SrfK